mgnify:CR=1 FL=1
MARRSKSSTRWLGEHFSDEFVKRAQAEGWRSRAVFKLEEIDAKDRLIRPGMTIVDLGAAPGGWSQYVAKKLHGKGRIIALDILDMPPIAGVEFVHGDFREAEPLSRLEALLGEENHHSRIFRELRRLIEILKGLNEVRVDSG